MSRLQALTWLGIWMSACAGGCRAPAGSAGNPGAQSPQMMTKQVTNTVNYKYWLYLPDDYGTDGRRWPLVLFLHGAGERGDDLERARIHGPPKLIAAGKAFPFIVVTPLCPADRWWDPNNLKTLLDEVIAGHAVDTDRVYCTGLSMGGYGTWALAIQYPEMFAAIAPICGGGVPYLTSRLKNVPTWAFHGAKDNVVSLEESQRMVDALKAAGGEANLTVYPEAQHDSWSATYENPELYSWLLSHKRTTESR